MPKLHELLAVFDDLKGQANKTRGDLLSTFSNKLHLFQKKVITFRSSQEGVPPSTESQSDIQSTLTKELKWVGQFISKAIDAGYQIDLGNTSATGNIVVEQDDKVVFQIDNVPATSLLQLEKHLTSVRDLLQAVPTLDSAQGFVLDTASGKGIWQARDVIKERTKKEKKVLVVSKATDKFPEQTQVYDADVSVGTLLSQEWSALTTPAIKSELLNRCDTLIQAVKKARSRANSVELDVAGQKIGKKLLDFVFEPLD